MALLALHDVEDAVRFSAAVVQRSGLELDYHEREDLTAWPVSECWLLSLRYQPGGVSFSTWAGYTLRCRIIDWQRKRNGRTRWTFGDGRVHERERPQLVPFDAAGLDESLSAGAGDPALDRDPDLARLLATSDRQRARDSA